jgi:hypothetical protein
MIAKVCLLTGIFSCVAVAQTPKTQWSRIGATDQVTMISPDGISLNVASPATAGAVSAPLQGSQGAEGILVRARVKDAAKGALTISSHGQDGDTLGYWQNIVAWKGPVEMAAVLPVSDHAADAKNADSSNTIRLFVGTDGCPSQAKIDDLKWQFVSPGDGYAGAIYARLVDDAHHCGQSFIAKGHLAAVKLRLRYLADKPGAGLKLSVYEWKGNITDTRKGHPIGEASLEAQRIPAGVEGNQRDIFVALNAPTRAGQRYLLEIAPDGPMPAGQHAALWSGPEDGKGGECFDNNRPIQQDLYFQAYDIH